MAETETASTFPGVLRIVQVLPPSLDLTIWVDSSTEVFRAISLSQVNGLHIRHDRIEAEANLTIIIALLPCISRHRCS